MGDSRVSKNRFEEVSTGMLDDSCLCEYDTIVLASLNLYAGHPPLDSTSLHKLPARRLLGLY